MATTNLGLEQPEYLSDGETGINAYKDNYAKIDALIGDILCYDGDILTYEDEILISVL